MTIKSELLALKDKQGLIVPARAVQWARAHPKSKLHNALQWDDAKAANEHRIWQVRQLINIHIIYEGNDRKVISLSIDRQRSGGGYREIDDVLKTPALHQILLADALRELERLAIKYNHVKELSEVWQVVETVKRRKAA